MHADQKLYLVFEFLDMDLKRFIELKNQKHTPITAELVKVCEAASSPSSSFLFPHELPNLLLRVFSGGSRYLPLFLETYMSPTMSLPAQQYAYLMRELWAGAWPLNSDHLIA